MVVRRPPFGDLATLCCAWLSRILVWYGKTLDNEGTVGLSEISLNLEKGTFCSDRSQQCLVDRSVKNNLKHVFVRKT